MYSDGTPSSHSRFSSHHHSNDHSYNFISTQNPNAIIQRLALMEDTAHLRADDRPSSPPLPDESAGNDTSSRPSLLGRHTGLSNTSSRITPRNGSNQPASNGNSPLENMFTLFHRDVLKHVNDSVNLTAVQRSRGRSGSTGNLSGSNARSDKRKGTILEGSIQKRKSLYRTPSQPQFGSYDSRSLNTSRSTTGSVMDSGDSKGKMRAFGYNHETSSGSYDGFALEDKSLSGSSTTSVGNSKRVSESFPPYNPPKRPLQRQDTLPAFPDVFSDSGSGSTSTSSSSSFLNPSSNGDSNSSRDTADSMDVDDPCPTQCSSPEFTANFTNITTSFPSVLPSILPSGTSLSTHRQRSFGGHTKNISKDTLSHSHSAPTVFSTETAPTIPERPARLRDAKGSERAMKQSKENYSSTNESSLPSSKVHHPSLTEQETKQKRKEKERQQQVQQVSQHSSSSSSSIAKQQAVTTTDSPLSFGPNGPGIPTKSQVQPQPTGRKYLGMRRPSNLPGKGTSYGSLDYSRSSTSGMSANSGSGSIGGLGSSQQNGIKVSSGNVNVNSKAATTTGPLRDINGLPIRQKGFKTPFKSGAQVPVVSGTTPGVNGTKAKVEVGGGTGARAQTTRALSKPSSSLVDHERREPKGPPPPAAAISVSRASATKRPEQGSHCRLTEAENVGMDIDDDENSKDADSSFDISFGMDPEEMEGVLRQYD
ncbi:hypothetical protein K435DRAFT_795272 [Dendrothele bispora CBS 962.96]|uniref:Uncharacterized protein n=1 Tax=Dendrothele bispora (strain CBS 962.96) TaxID=1314807 RepID=A0A4S8M9Z4_DENBC|nr:hypothetical protein K435DRAFT_795272 [Dendrothele bispora CBS 962.96]